MPMHMIVHIKNSMQCSVHYIYCITSLLILLLFPIISFSQCSINFDSSVDLLHKEASSHIPDCTWRSKGKQSWNYEHTITYIVTALELMVHVLMRDVRRKEERSKQDQTNNKAESQPILIWKSDCLGCVVLLCLVVCLTFLLPSFFHL